jgi:hypothetical protein
MPKKRRFHCPTFTPHISLTVWLADSLLGVNGAAQAPSKHKVRTRDKIGELQEENRKLRELVAHLSKLALTRITESAEPEEQPANTES